jgi:hypothetical protein
VEILTYFFGRPQIVFADQSWAMPPGNGWPQSWENPGKLADDFPGGGGFEERFVASPAAPELFWVLGGEASPRCIGGVNLKIGKSGRVWARFSNNQTDCRNSCIICFG